MTASAIKKAFRQMNNAEQAQLLTDLAASLADSLTEMDFRDAAVFRARRAEEARARPWVGVRSALRAATRRKR